MPDVQCPGRPRRRRPDPFVRQWRDLLVPTESLEVPRPRGLRHATYQRLVNEYNRLLEEIAALPQAATLAAHADGVRVPVLEPHRAHSAPAWVAHSGAAREALVSHGRGCALPGRLHQVRLALDGERLSLLRARRPLGAPVLRR